MSQAWLDHSPHVQPPRVRMLGEHCVTGPREGLIGHPEVGATPREPSVVYPLARAWGFHLGKGIVAARPCRPPVRSMGLPLGVGRELCIRVSGRVQPYVIRTRG